MRPSAASALWACLIAAPVAGQTLDSGGVAPPTHERSAVSALALRLPVGSRDDPAGQEGTAWLLARAVARQLEASLAPIEARVGVEVTRDATLFTVLVSVTDGPVADRLTRTVFDAPIDGAALEAERARLASRLAFEAGSPVAEFESEAMSLFGDGGAWSRPVRGTLESVASVGPEAVERLRRSHYLPERGALAWTEPAGGGSAGPGGPDAARPASLEAAWTTPARHVIVREVTSTWIAVAAPAPAGASRTSLEWIAHLIRERLDPSPPDPHRYGLDVAVEAAPGGTIVVVRTAVAPEASDDWEARIVNAFRAVADVAEGDAFRWSRRRFRAVRLLDDAAPEARTARMSADLLREGRVRDLDAEIWAVTPAALSATARALGPPRILRLGPDLGQGTAGGS